MNSEEKREALRSAIIHAARNLRNTSVNIGWADNEHTCRDAWEKLDSALKMLDDHAVGSL